MLDSLMIIRGNGPILITGPHSVKTIRNKKEVHHEEEYIYEIVHKLYKIFKDIFLYDMSSYIVDFNFFIMLTFTYNINLSVGGKIYF